MLYYEYINFYKLWIIISCICAIETLSIHGYNIKKRYLSEEALLVRIFLERRDFLHFAF